VKARQFACSAPACQSARRKQTQATWRAANPGYAVAYRIASRAAEAAPADTSASAAPAGSASAVPAGSASKTPAPPTAPSSPRAPPSSRMPPPLDGLPWDLAKDEFGVQGAEFLAVFGRVLVRMPKDQSASQGLGMTQESG
jgi:hypothetical protein